jgi:micrococcal nuclease
MATTRAAIAVTVALLASACGSLGQRLNARPTTTTIPVVEADKVTRIVDGDTVVTANHPEKIRLIGVDTPELHKPGTPVQCYAQQAADHLAQLIPVGVTVRVTYDRAMHDRYGRTLAYVDNPVGVGTPTGDVGLNQIQGGYAVADYISPNKARRMIYDDAMNRARDAKVGMWAACPTKPKPRP